MISEIVELEPRDKVWQKFMAAFPGLMLTLVHVGVWEGDLYKIGTSTLKRAVDLLCVEQDDIFRTKNVPKIIWSYIYRVQRNDRDGQKLIGKRELTVEEHREALKKLRLDLKFPVKNKATENPNRKAELNAQLSRIRKKQ